MSYVTIVANKLLLNTQPHPRTGAPLPSPTDARGYTRKHRPVECDELITIKPVECDDLITIKPVECDDLITIKPVECDDLITMQDRVQANSKVGLLISRLN